MPKEGDLVRVYTLIDDHEIEGVVTQVEVSGIELVCSAVWGRQMMDQRYFVPWSSVLYVYYLPVEKS